MQWEEGRSDHGVSSRRFEAPAKSPTSPPGGKRQKKSQQQEEMVLDIKGLSVESSVVGCPQTGQLIEEALNERKAIRADPFRQGFEHASKVDLDNFRLCFQVL